MTDCPSHLKSCPFCGYEATLIDSWGMAIVLCANCLGRSHHFTEKRDAINAWNRRSIPEHDRVEIFRLLIEDNPNWREELKQALAKLRWGYGAF